MKKHSLVFLGLTLSVLFFFGASTFIESSAWARAGRGGSFGSRGSKSFSSPQMPSGPLKSSPGIGNPGRNPLSNNPGPQSSGGFLGRSPFMQGLAGGLAGGMLGSLLFGGTGHAARAGGFGGGGMGLLDILLIGLLAFVAWRLFKKWRARNAVASGSYGNSPQGESYSSISRTQYGHPSLEEPEPGYGELQRGLDQIRRYDPGFDEERAKENFQDLFFRIQAGWANRSLEGIEALLTDEMREVFRKEFDSMQQRGVVNHLENIAIRKVELSEAWQETGIEYVTVLFTANLLDYTVDEASGQVVAGDRLHPVKFQEFWTFSREIGSSEWRLSAISQMEEERFRVVR